MEVLKLSKSPDLIKRKLADAERKAKSLGNIIGRVSRKMFSKMTGNASTTMVEVDVLTYYELGDELGVGNFLAAIDIRSGKAVGLKVVSISRADMASTIDSFQPLQLSPDVGGLLTHAFIEAVTLLDEDGIPFTVPIEPQSPVIVPKNPELLANVAGLPKEGITLGVLHTGSHPVAGGSIKLKLPKKEFFKHVLVIGTTGSGKTTFIKNLMYTLKDEWPTVKTCIIDAAGDYTQSILPPASKGIASERFKNRRMTIERITVLLPVKRGDRDIRALAAQYVMERLGGIAKAFFNKELRVGIVRDSLSPLISVEVEACLTNHCFTVNIVPVSPSYQQVRDHLEIFPLFSRQAKVYLQNVVNYLEDVEGGVANFTHLHKALEANASKILETLKIHRRTLENIERAINFIASSEEIDSMLGRRPIGMPKADELMKNSSGPIVLDLDYAAIRGAHYLTLNMIAYEFMREIYSWKKSGEGSLTPVLLVLDEAHRFFPSEGTTREEVELLADFISRVARLGRAKGMGLIFSTHSPKDVHKIVIQLTNTKIIFRSEREFLEMLDVPQELLRLMELIPDRVALARSSTFRTGHALFQTPEPLLGHFDLGRLSVGESGNVIRL
jgi:DNA helicase HerA-like ATPase/truncated hemoglobin YjbI